MLENQLKVHEVHKNNIIDNGADTSVIGKGWHVLAHTNRKVNVAGFDKKCGNRENSPVVTAVTCVDMDGETVHLKINQAVHNRDAHHSLLSDFQVRERCPHLDVVSKRHKMKQIFKPNP